MVQDAAPSHLTGVFNTVLKEGVFPTRWKKARLALIPKPGKPVGQPSSYRPLCLLDTVGKIFERTIVDRLENHFRAKKTIASSQYGFRTGRSTVDAAIRLKTITQAAMRKRQFCAAVSLDIQNAFKSMPWPNILEALANAKVPGYLVRIVRSYLDDRWIMAETSAGVVCRRLPAGLS